MSHWVALLPELDEEQRRQVIEAVDPLSFIVQQGWAGAEQAVGAAAAHYGVPALQLSRYAPDAEVVRLLSEEQARRLRAVPLFRIRHQLFTAMCDPDDLAVQDFISRLTGLVVEPVLSHPADIDQAITRWMLTAEHIGRLVDSIAAERLPETSDFDHHHVVEDRDAPVIRMVDNILSQAIRLGVSDIHLEPFADYVSLRYRIDGQLCEYPAPPRAMYAAVVSRLKIASMLDIAERRLPQDGRSSLSVDGRKYDLRISVIPNVHGEGIVIRVLNPYAVQLDLAALGFDEDLKVRYEKLLRKPHGIILVTGPTGSGKSTTLYATLRHIMDVRRKVITLEDPVEYQLPGITQIQVQSDIGYSFAEGLKAILRHDPDTVLVGEIRDLESAQIAIRAALTGHQMFSTLHTNDAPQAVTRLRDMGVPLYQIMASLNGVLAQRLLRRLCLACRQQYQPEAAELRALGVPPEKLAGPFYRASGCSECRQLGYRGRVAVYEFLEMTSGVRNLDPDQATFDRVRQVAESEGAFLSMKASALDKFLQGITSAEEVWSLAS